MRWSWFSSRCFIFVLALSIFTSPRVPVCGSRCAPLIERRYRRALAQQAGATAGGDIGATATSRPPYLDPSLPAEQRVDDLVSRNAGESLEVDADVRNVGERAGDEVVEVYLSSAKTSWAPIRALRGCTRVHLGVGEIRHLHFTLDPRQLSEVNESGDRLVATGEYRVSVGGGQPGTGAPVVEATFTILGEQRLPE